LHEPPPHVRDIVPNVPKRVDTLIAHMLARSPGDRLASAAEVSASLDPALVMTGWDVETVSSHATAARTGRGAPTVTRQAADLGMQPTMPIKIERLHAGRVAMGALFGSVALFAGLLVWRQGQSNAVESAPPVVSTSPRTDSAAQRSLSAPAKPATVDSMRPAPGAAAKKVAGARDSAKKNKPAAKSAAPTTPLAKTTVPPPPVSDETAIDDALGHFTVVMGNGEVSIRNAFPGMPAPLLENLKTIFTNTDKVSARSTHPAPTINGDHAEVVLTVSFQFQRRGSPQPETAVLKYDATLTKRGTQWELTGLAQHQ
jgi:hypothetical protein